MFEITTYIVQENVDAPECSICDTYASWGSAIAPSLQNIQNSTFIIGKSHPLAVAANAPVNSIIFYNPNSQRIIGSLKGSQINQTNFNDAVRNIDGLKLNGEGDLITSDGTVVGEGNGGTLLEVFQNGQNGIGDFFNNLPIGDFFNNLPIGILLAKGLLFSYGAYRSKGVVKKTACTAIALMCFNKLRKKLV